MSELPDEHGELSYLSSQEGYGDGEDPIDIGLEHDDEDLTGLDDVDDTEGDGGDTPVHPLAQVVEPLPEGAKPQVIDLKNPKYVGYFDIEPHTLLTGIKSLKDFNYPEQAIVHALMDDPEQIDPAEALNVHAPGISRRPILHRLQPAGFHGVLLHASVELAPFSPDLAMEHSTTLRDMLPDHLLHDPTPFRGITAIYRGELRASTGRLGPFALATTYHALKAPLSEDDPQPRIVRTMGSLGAVARMEQELLRRRGESKAAAQAVESLNRIYLYRGAGGYNKGAFQG